jgi:hypothetical protein
MNLLYIFVVSRHHWKMAGHRLAMVEKTDLLNARWWRFSQYEIQNGYIVPAPGARLEEYDPWRAYSRAKQETAAQSPYVSLFRLLSRHAGEIAALDHAFDGIEELSPTAATDFAQWCSEWGLLGILPHLYDYLELPPVWMDVPEPDDFLNDDVWNCVPFAASPLYERRGGRWVAGYKEVPLKDSRSVELRNDPRWLAEHQEGTPVPQDLLHQPKYSFRRRRLPTEFQSVANASTERLRKFFPVLSDASASLCQIPVPLSTDFWIMYAEPLREFLAFATALHHAAEGVSSRSDSIVTSKAVLSSFTEGVSLSINPDSDPGLRQTWHCPSLLSCFAQMLVQDFMSDASYRRCACCGLPFVTGAYQARYCSQQCGWRDRKRRKRTGPKDRQTDRLGSDVTQGI